MTEKQEAERRVNKLESKIDELEDRVERAESNEYDTRTDFRRVESLNLARTRTALDYLSSMDGDDERLTTTYVAPGENITDILDKELESDTDTLALLRQIDSSTGIVLVLDDFSLIRACLVPPLAVTESRTEHAPAFELDRSLFEPSGSYAVAVVRSDSYAGGVYENTERTAFSSHSSNVKSKHSKGGFSQGRFERIRNDQIDEHLDDSVEKFGEMLNENDGDTPDYVCIGGERAVAEEFSDRISVDAPTHVKSLDSTGGGEELLEKGYESFWTTRFYVF
ncbi:MAG: Vms1/Ankzf1 family peptidyl-tRNA hydrolase [Halobacteria archaeon]|nr:Vms1/Ankzf1 family peptidyl-tRNA hydrolase [Halobacteria archaeon]